MGRKKITHQILEDISLVNIISEYIEYDDNLTREDYLLFINEMLKLHTIPDGNLNNDRDSIFMKSEYYKKFFGRYTEGGCTFWKFSKLKQNLKDAGLINVSDYHFDLVRPEKSRPSEISFTDKFKSLYEEYQIQFGMNEISNKQFKKLLSNKKIPGKDCVSRKHYDLLKSERVDFNIEDYAKNISKNDLVKNWRVVSFINKDLFTIFDEKTGRVYSSFTSLKRDARPYILIDGERLDSLDLKSSQPLLFVHYLKSININNLELEKLKNIIIKDDVYYWFLNKYIEINGSNNYEEYCEVDKKMINGIIKDRDDAKTQLFRFLYKSNRGSVPFQKVFQIEFPNLYEEIKIIKRKLNNNYNTNLAIKMQKLESDIFIPVANKYTEEGALSLHDGIYFKPELKERIRKDIEDQMEKFGIDEYELK